MGHLTVGGVAKRAAVKAQTIHYYERRGLLPPPPRSSSNYRLYEEGAVRRVLFVKKAQRLGFTLEEIRELLTLRAEPRDRCDEVRGRAEAKVHEIGVKIRALEAMRTALAGLIDECAGRAPASECPVLKALDAEGGE